MEEYGFAAFIVGIAAGSLGVVWVVHLAGKVGAPTAMTGRSLARQRTSNEALAFQPLAAG